MVQPASIPHKRTQSSTGQLHIIDFIVCLHPLSTYLQPRSRDLLCVWPLFELHILFWHAAALILQ